MGTLEQRLLSKTRRQGACLLWTGFVLPNNGYGMIRDGSRMELTHRVSFRLFKGRIPDGKRVLHTCDVPNCIEPCHLFLGTQKDNVHDCMRKGRRAVPLKHENNPRSLLTWRDVDMVRTSEDSYRELSIRLGVSVSLISKIRTNQLWKEEDRPNGCR